MVLPAESLQQLPLQMNDDLPQSQAFPIVGTWPLVSTTKHAVFDYVDIGPLREKWTVPTSTAGYCFLILVLLAALAIFCRRVSRVSKVVVKAHERTEPQVSSHTDLNIWNDEEDRCIAYACTEGGLRPDFQQDSHLECRLPNADGSSGLEKLGYLLGGLKEADGNYRRSERRHTKPKRYADFFCHGCPKVCRN